MYIYIYIYIYISNVFIVIRFVGCLSSSIFIFCKEGKAKSYFQLVSSPNVSYLIQKLKGLEAKGPFVQFDSS